MSKRTELIDYVVSMTGLDKDDCLSMLHGMHLTSKQFIEIAEIHYLRAESNAKCSDCIYAKDCAWLPMLRYMLLNYHDKNINSLKNRKDYRNG